MSVALTINVGSSITVQARDPRIVAVGVSGPQGPQGDTGAAATIAVGTKTTGAAGSSVNVVNSGTSSAAVFDFTIPRGDTGATGDWSTAQTLNPQSGNSYTIASTDPGKLVTFSGAGTGTPATVTVTVPTGIASVGQRIDLAQLGTGQVSVTGGSGVTINSTPTVKLRTQYSAATLICTATTATPTATFLLVGDLAAS